LIGLEQRIVTKDEEIAAGEKTTQALVEAVSTLRTRYQNMVEQVQRLEAMDMASKAKERAVGAIRQAGKVASVGSDVSIDAVADRIQRRADIADAKFERALGEMNAFGHFQSQKERMKGQLWTGS
jgi:phage shock protein A